MVILRLFDGYLTERGVLVILSCKSRGVQRFQLLALFDGYLIPSV